MEFQVASQAASVELVTGAIVIGYIFVLLFVIAAVLAKWRERVARVRLNAVTDTSHQAYAFLKDLFDSLDDAVVLTDGHYKIVAVNPAATLLFGPSEKIIGTHFNQYINPKTYDIRNEWDTQHHPSMQKSYGVFDLDWNGKKKHIEYASIKTRDGHKLFILKDVTRSHKRDSELHRHKEKLEWANEELIQTKITLKERKKAVSKKKKSTK